MYPESWTCILCRMSVFSEGGTFNFCLIIMRYDGLRTKRKGQTAMLFRILKKDMMRKKVMNLILLLFIILASMFVASGLSNVATVLSGTDFYLDKAGIGDYMVITGGDGAYSALDDFLKNDKDIKGYRMEHLIFSSKEDILLEGKESVTKNTSILVSVDEDGIDYFDKDNNVITSVQPGHVYVPLAFLEENGLKKVRNLGIKSEREIVRSFFSACYYRMTQREQERFWQKVIENSKNQ